MTVLNLIWGGGAEEINSKIGGGREIANLPRCIKTQLPLLVIMILRVGGLVNFLYIVWGPLKKVFLPPPIDLNGTALTQFIPMDVDHLLDFIKNKHFVFLT